MSEKVTYITAPESTVNISGSGSTVSNISGNNESVVVYITGDSSELTVSEQTSNFSISGGSEDITITNDQNDVVSTITYGGVQGAPGVGVPAGGEPEQIVKRTATGTKWDYDWSMIALNFKFNGTTTVIPGGKVREGTYSSLGTIYKYTTDAKTGLYPTEDSFYLNFDGTNLTNLLTTRG